MYTILGVTTRYVVCAQYMYIVLIVLPFEEKRTGFKKYIKIT